RDLLACIPEHSLTGAGADRAVFHCEARLFLRAGDSPAIQVLAVEQGLPVAAAATVSGKSRSDNARRLRVKKSPRVRARPPRAGAPPSARRGAGFWFWPPFGLPGLPGSRREWNCGPGMRPRKSDCAVLSCDARARKAGHGRR